MAKINWLNWNGNPERTKLCAGFLKGHGVLLDTISTWFKKAKFPPGSSSVPGIPNVFELRDEDGRAWYRVIHLKKLDDKIYVLHCFEKQSNQIEKRDIRTIEKRLGSLNKRLAEGRRNAKREKSKQPHAAHDDGKRSR